MIFYFGQQPANVANVVFATAIPQLDTRRQKYFKFVYFNKQCDVQTNVILQQCA